MIITKLHGGLGNQLFQYSLGRYLAAKHDVELKLDTSWYGTVPDRQYDLDHFHISGTVATPIEIAKLKESVTTKVKDKVKPFIQRTYIKERGFTFDPAVLQVGSRVYLDGYWQSEKYFIDIADVIRQEFTLKAKPHGNNALLLKQIQSTNAISLHVRRGDYVSNQQANAFHGTSPLEYYQKAVERLTKEVKEPHFFIFSDDPQWTKENLTFNYPLTFVTGNDKAAQEDLRLMSHCRHFIIANSTFSWWGAWLSSHAKKTVIAPEPWFRNNANDDKDLVPKQWIRL